MNKVVLIGRLTKDPDLKFTAGNGNAVSNFTLAVNRVGKDKEADFINCVAFGKIAETIAQYLTKGRQLAVFGNIRTGSYEAQDGTKRYTTDVYVEGFDFVDSGSNKQEKQEAEIPVTSFAGTPYENNDMEPVDDGDIPF